MIIELMLNIILFFFVYSFLGWVLEVLYKLIIKRELLNPGFFQGPILPIYGVSVFIILAVFTYSPWGMAVNILLTVFLVTGLEYLVALFCEKVIGTKFWDYSNMKFDYKGRISLEFSFIWGFLIAIFVLWLHPLLRNYIIKIPITYQLFLVLFLLMLFIFDFILTTIELFNLRKVIKKLEKMTQLDDELRKYFVNFKRLLKAFPDFYKQLEKKVVKILDKKL